MREDPTTRRRTRRAPDLPSEEEAALEGYYRTLSGAAAIGNALATEPPEGEVADLLRRRSSAEPTPGATADRYRREGTTGDR